MKIYQEKSLSDFEAWSGGESTMELLDFYEFNIIEDYLEELYPDGMDEYELNDFLWFETDTIAELLGYESFEELYKERNGEDNEE